MSSTPHNDLFLETFSNPSRAAAHLRTLVPQAIAEAAMWSEMRLAPSEFASVGQGTRRSDLLFELPFRTDPELVGAEPQSPLLLYVLFEHQSTMDRDMTVRMLIYMALIWDTWLRERAGSGEPLPFIYPLVLYHGRDRWTAKTQFADMFRGSDDVLRALHPFIPRFEYHLQDLQQTEELTPVDDPIVQAVLSVFVSREFAGALLALAHAFDTLEGQLAHDEDLRVACQSLVTYVLFAFEDSDNEALRRALHRPSTPVGDIVMNGGQRLIQEGIEQGIEQGIERANRATVARLITLGVDEATIARATDLDAEQIQQIRAEIEQD